MFENAKVRWTIILGILLLSVWWFLPNVIDTKNISYLPKSKIVKGLDIQGGIHLVLGIEMDAYLNDKMDRFVKTFNEDFKKENIPFVEITPVKDPKRGFQVKVASSSDLKKVSDYVNKVYPGVLQPVTNESSNTITFSYFDNVERQLKTNVANQAIEVIRNRIDSYGTLEPNISTQGEDRILIQLPGIEDSKKAKELINTTAKLEFMIVDDAFDMSKLEAMITEAEKAGNYALGTAEKNGLDYIKYVRRINEDLKGKLPPNSEVVFQKPEAVENLTQAKIPYLVKNDEIVSGDMIEDAYVSKDPQIGRPEVAFQMSVEGRKPFGDLTGKNVNKRMAIILDKVMKTAPTLQSKISDAGRITLGTGNYQQIFEEADFISRTLRAGALPATLVQLEERTVGPTLGSDSVDEGEFAGIIGGALIFFFMVGYYGFVGFVASLALAFNVLITLAVLSTLGATLTLPGVAGIVLGLGMSVDANVVIFERIKDELKAGRGILMSIKDGFSNAYAGIFDSNLMSAVVCIVLLQFGSGPIRGFAVTLMIGVVASMFTAVFASRSVIELFVQKFKFKKIIRL